MSLFNNKDLYPTPIDVIERMLSGVDLSGKIVLEPSAGMGNIVDYLQEFGAKEVIACEISNDLAKIVASKCRLIASDFLQLSSVKISHIDMIVMNPPFSNEERHILHAWDIAPDGCTIISLCNSSVVKSKYTEARKKIAEIIKDNGRSEHFGDCFSIAERKTDVEVSCIWLYKPKTGDDEFADYFCLEEEVEEQEIGISKYNYVRDIVNRYVGAIKLYDKIMPIADEINKLTATISKYGIRFGAYKTGEMTFSDNAVSRETYKKSLQKQAWERIFSDMNMGKYVTYKVKENINKFVETQVHVPFTMKNIYKMIDIIVGTHASRMNQVLIDAFEQICGFSYENSTAGEKWKTNSDYMINRKFITPCMCEYDFYGYKNIHVTLTSYGMDKINDIVKALCHLVGLNYDKIQTLQDFTYNVTNAKEDEVRISMDWGTWYEWGFFRIRGYKKGTMHFEFLDENVWMQFNRRVAEIKGWRLPNSTRKAGERSKKVAVI